MITKLTHVSVYVLDQASAYDFYTKKLGFKVITDVPMGNGHRWLGVYGTEALFKDDSGNWFSLAQLGQ